MLKAGDKAPEFRLKADDGNDVALSDFRGQRVILFFFPKANTSG
jgi:peroxiredoxin Q/BCP